MGQQHHFPQQYGMPMPTATAGKSSGQQAQPAKLKGKKSKKALAAAAEAAEHAGGELILA